MLGKTLAVPVTRSEQCPPSAKGTLRVAGVGARAPSRPPTSSKMQRAAGRPRATNPALLKYTNASVSKARAKRAVQTVRTGLGRSFGPDIRCTLRRGQGALQEVCGGSYINAAAVRPGPRGTEQHHHMWDALPGLMWMQAPIRASRQEDKI